MRDLLAITVPAFNRAETLCANLEKLLPTLARHDVPIYVSDDSDNDQLAELLEDLRRRWHRIYYRKNPQSLGHDKNFLSALRAPSSDYVWLFGDRVALDPDSIEIVLEHIRRLETPCLIAVNKQGRAIVTESGFYEDCEFLLKVLGWHLTYTGATIYPYALIDSIEEDTHVPKNFPQVYLIFNWLAKQEALFWINQSLITSSGSGGSYWKDDPLNVFINDWEVVVNSLPQNYSRDAKATAILSHSINTNLFSGKLFLRLRALEKFSVADLVKYKIRIFSHSSVNPVLLILIAVLPKSLLRLLYRLKKRYQHHLLG